MRHPAARGGTPVGRVASAARPGRGAATQAMRDIGNEPRQRLWPGAAATLRPGGLCAASFVARRRCPASTPLAPRHRQQIPPARPHASSTPGRRSGLSPSTHPSGVRTCTRSRPPAAALRYRISKRGQSSAYHSRTAWAAASPRTGQRYSPPVSLASSARDASGSSHMACTFSRCDCAERAIASRSAGASPAAWPSTSR